MNHDPDETRWPLEAGDPNALAREREPPPELEDRVVGALLERGLIGREPRNRAPGWRMLRAALAAAACVGLIAVGALIGRASIDAGPVSPLTGAETDLYALLLLETEGYDAPSGPEALARYGEYSRWVAEARKRGQFVTGEDLEVEHGWTLIPSPDGPVIEPTAPATAAAAAPLSGIFFIRAAAPEQALALARELPHLKHGGQVIVQKTIPTDTPPALTIN